MGYADTRRVRGIALLALPLLLILAARLATYSDWAEQNSAAAALLFVWVVIDTLALMTIAKAPRFRPGVRAIIGAMAAGSAIAVLGSAEHVRMAMLSMLPLIIAMIGTLLIYVVWSGWLATSVWLKTHSAEAAISQIVPSRLAHFITSELQIVRICLLSWGRKPLVPTGATGFAYHRYLTPMLAVFLVLQLIELAVVHLLVSLWNETAALILLALSIWGAIWLIALMKSFRLYPVLLSKTHLHVRSGLIVDCAVPIGTIARVEAGFSAEQLKAKSTLNLALMSSPNICLVLSQPVRYRTFSGAMREVDRIGLRLDDGPTFLAALPERLR